MREMKLRQVDGETHGQKETGREGHRKSGENREDHIGGEI